MFATAGGKERWPAAGASFLAGKVFNVATLMQTMGRWADGQNWLQAEPPARRLALEPLLAAAAVRLRRHGSLGELAGAFYADDAWFEHLAQEFAVADAERERLRGAAYWARLMEIRHPARHLDAHPETRR